MVLSGRAIATVLGVCLFGASCSSSGAAELTEPPPIEVQGDRPQGLPFEDVTFDEDAFRLALPKPSTIDPAQVSLVDQSAVIAGQKIKEVITSIVRNTEIANVHRHQVMEKMCSLRSIYLEIF